MYGSPITMCMTSAHIVPKTATIATADQYGQVRYVGVRNCHVIASAKSTNPTTTARYLLTSFTR